MKRIFSGYVAWLLQRLTALYLLAFGLFLLAHFVFHPPQSHVEWRTWVLSGANNELVFVFLMAIFLHMWVGLRDVILDYVHPAGVRLGALCLVGLCLVFMSVRAVGMLLFTQP